MYLWLLLLFGTAICSPNQTPLYGVITSPNYPDSYPNNNQTYWDIAVPEGYRISLNFLVFDIEPSENCNYDFVKVFADNEELGRFCGSVTSRRHPGHRHFVSQGDRMRVEFQSDFSNEDDGAVIHYKGFQAYYQALDRNECVNPGNSVTWTPPCQHTCHNYVGGYFCSCFRGYQLQSDGKTCKAECSREVFTEETGYIFSPGYPKPYPPDLNCNYSIRLEKGLLISLSFQGVFEIDDHPKALCPYDTLKVFADGKILKTFCGRQSPGSLKTRSNSVDVVFETDDSGDSKGWKLWYSSEAIQCPIPVPRDEFTIISPMQKEYRMRDYIVVTCQTGYKLMEGDVEQRGFTSLCQRDGTWHRAIPRCEIVRCKEPEILINGELTYLTAPGSLTYLSVITYTCNAPFYSMVTATGSAKFTCSAQHVWKDENGGAQLPRCIPVCGQPWDPVTSNVSRGRIISGKPARIGNFPWQILLTKYGRSGAALIGEHWVLTAAHVLRDRYSNAPAEDDPSSVKVYMGGVDVDEIIKLGYHEVEGYHVHPDYNPKNFDNDIALVRLRYPVVMNQNVAPICLPEPGKDFIYADSRKGYVSGYGETENQTISTNLRYVAVPMVGRHRCQAYLDKHKKENPDNVFTENMFCAGYPEGGDSCQGDSGGAHVAQDQKGTWVAAGIVSWGIGCGHGFGFYTKVSNYIDWILGYTGK
ncbi:complement C1r subcomponent [Spea bombifrons]|uniref:complement C1r subcomponent n=1 Tax=Spea bombifrons TaxID=233779 RepID=UPI00234B0286|nr:complement C1r subcomponent [Spea bombifrons]